MSRKSTTEEFITKATALHGNRYDYSSVVYKDSKTPVIIICKTHGSFSQAPTKHLQPCGCKKCADTASGESRASTTEKFLEKASKLYGDKFDYSKVRYKRAVQKVTISCRKHGDFLQTPNDHLNLKNGCSACRYESDHCGGRLNKEEFVRRSAEHHSDKYEYSLVKYKTSKDRVKIICPTHGVFEQKAIDHMLGKGCRSCMKTGYQPNLPGILYVLRCGDITKVGITNKEVGRRVKEISRSSGKKFEVLTYIRFESGQIPDDIETNILRELRESHESVQEKFDGSTECFLNVNYGDLLLRIAQLATQFLSAVQ